MGGTVASALRSMPGGATMYYHELVAIEDIIFVSSPPPRSAGRRRWIVPLRTLSDVVLAAPSRAAIDDNGA